MVIFLIIAAGLAPIVTAFGIVLWYTHIHGNAEAAELAGSVAVGLAAGAIFGTAVGVGLILLVIALAHALSH